MNVPSNQPGHFWERRSCFDSRLKPATRSGIRLFGSVVARAGAAAFLLTLIIAVAVFGSAGSSSAADEESYKTADGLAVYLGLMPAQVVRGHAPGHAERTMHGGPPASVHDYHLVVAVFDAGSGSRIEDATVTATISGLGHVGTTRLPLEPMSMTGTVTYGGYIAFRGDDRYTIAIEVLPAGAHSPVQVEFAYRHDQS
jgi:hypothetical protein